MISFLPSFAHPASIFTESLQGLFNAYSTTFSELNLPISSQEPSSKKWSVWTHLPVAALGALAVAQAIGTVVFFVLGNTPIAIIFGVSTVASTYGVMCLINYIPMMGLAGYVRMLAENATRLRESVQHVREENRELKSTVATLKKESDSNIQELRNQEQKLKTALDSLQKTSQNLIQAESKIQGLDQLLKRFDTTTADITTKVATFVRENQHLSSTKDMLATDISKLTEMKKSLETSSVEISHGVDEIKDARTQAENTTRLFRDTLVQMTNLLINFQQEYSLAKIEVERLQKTSQNIATNADSIHKAVDIFSEKKNELEEQVTKIEAAAAKKARVSQQPAVVHKKPDEK